MRDIELLGSLAESLENAIDTRGATKTIIIGANGRSNGRAKCSTLGGSGR